MFIVKSHKTSFQKLYLATLTLFLNFLRRLSRQLTITIPALRFAPQVKINRSLWYTWPISSVVFKMQMSSSISIFIVIVRNSQPSKEVSGGNGENLILSVICYTVYLHMGSTSAAKYEPRINRLNPTFRGMRQPTGQDAIMQNKSPWRRRPCRRRARRRGRCARRSSWRSRSAWCQTSARWTASTSCYCRTSSPRHRSLSTHTNHKLFITWRRHYHWE